MNTHTKSVFSIVLLAILCFANIGVAQGQEDPTVVSADPSSALQGTVDLDVQVTGTGFDNSATVEFSLPNNGPVDEKITVKKVKVRGSKKLIATITVAADAVEGSRDIEVSLSRGGRGRGTELFNVEKNNGGGATQEGPYANVVVSGDLFGPFPDGDGLMSGNNSQVVVNSNNSGGPVGTHLDMNFFNALFGGRGATCFVDVASNGLAVVINENKFDPDRAELLFVFVGVLADGLGTRAEYELTLGGTFREGWFFGDGQGELQKTTGGAFAVGEILNLDFTDWTLEIAGKGKRSPHACIGSGAITVSASVERTG